MMALVPSRQFCPTTTIFFDSFQSSFSRFNGTHLRLFRYGPSNSFKRHNLHTTQMALFSHILENQQNKSNFVFRNGPISRCNHKLNLCSSSSSSGNWMDKWNEPQKQKLPKQPRAALNYRSSENVSGSSYGNGDNGGGGGGGGSSTMEKIVEKLKKFGYIDDVNKKEKVERVIEKGSVEDIFYVEEGMLPNARGGFSKESPLGVEDVFRGGDGEVRFPWEKTAAKEAEERELEKKKSRSSMAELTIPEPELRRLRNLAIRTKHKTKVGGGGVTQAVVDMIHEKWKAAEIVRLKIEGPPALNMRRMHEILERKTGGLVIWRSGTSLSLYRGVSYEDPSVQLYKKRFNEREFPENSFSTPIDKTGRDPSRVISNKDVHAPYANLESTAVDKEDAEPLVEVKYENEVDKLLDGLGPRYTDWPGCDPLPVDADLLPGIVPGYQPPFRILPYGLRATLGQKEATNLRRLARVLPPHFALGRSRQLQGLAVAMIKLWERSSIAKITLKRGVQLTTSERMAEDIKKLTGGVLLSRNKDFLVFYRGKSFLSPDVTEALLERERVAKSMQDEEELARLRASALFTPSVEITGQSGIAGTLSETLDADARWATKLDNRGKEKLMREAEVLRHANLVRKLEKKLSFAERKLMKAERTLSKVEVFLRPTEPSADPESITDEERFMLRKLGLRMKAFLLLGRRGVFDGTVENMHLHWKYRELVKIMVKAKTFDQVKKVAISLEAESGGLLVSVDKVSKGYAIVVFRGKDYQRPSYLRPKNLLTKRKALARSIELQRREALNGHISTMQKRVEKLRSEIERMDFVKGHGDEELYDNLDSAYSTDDEDTDTEDEGDEAYLETFECENDGEVENDDSINNLLPETDLPYDIENLDLETESEVPESNAHGTASTSSIRADDIKKEVAQFVTSAHMGSSSPSNLTPD